MHVIIHDEPMTSGAWGPVETADHFAQMVGPLSMLVMPGNPEEPVRIGFRVEEKHCNKLGGCHGGMLGTVLDLALGYVANFARQEEGTPTISLSVDFLRPAPAGTWIESRCRLIETTRRMIFVDGLLICRQGTVARGNAIYRRPSRNG
ncbi:PaaI family thioesterase [Niveispirillum sp.]|uniref:PaaI family thioesterase n=1 Tax=Niveispirillum sp. TaxID=1917217 RepID=UPI001B6F56E4|nr:PaaI family thioesterase [Niveispirillum sp.]MBP7336858.1 PaaI family thioesterase [Niveispirillum sp.]